MLGLFVRSVGVGRCRETEWCGALRFGACDQAGFGGRAEFRERGRAAFDAVGAMGHAVRVAVEEAERDQAFAGADRDLRRDGRQRPQVGQHLQRGGPSFSGCGRRPDASADCSSDWRTR